MKRGCVALWLLSLVDYFITIYCLNHGYAWEGNPVANWIFSQSYALAFLFKQGLITIACAIVWMKRTNRKMRLPLGVGLSAYSLLIAYEVVGLVLVA